MEPRDEELYRLGLAMGRTGAHVNYWEQPVADTRAFGKSPGLVRARKAGYTEEQAKIYAEGYAQALQECRAADFYYNYREQMDKQLPPVCPLGWREVKESPELCLWSLSAVYLGSLLQAFSVEQLAAAYRPDFTLLRKYNLGCSYRFGGALASILSDSVYEGILRGMAPTGTSITVFHAPHSGKSRDSPNEAAVIARLLQGAERENCAVITPYRKQAALLHKAIPDGDIMTIHKAQGLEWDTVIISAVDAEEMFFCDSTKSRGNALLNTALSRAKKHLVIVCDAECWAKRSRQLLGRLVLAANGAVA